MCYDAYAQCQFVLRAHIIAWTGDIPALTKIMNVTGHNSYSGCRLCKIQGIHSEKYNHIYYHPGNYAKKTHSDWLVHIDEIESATSSKDQETLMRQYGNKIITELLL